MIYLGKVNAAGYKAGKGQNWNISLTGKQIQKGTSNSKVQVVKTKVQKQNDKAKLKTLANITKTQKMPGQRQTKEYNELAKTKGNTQT